MPPGTSPLFRAEVRGVFQRPWTLALLAGLAAIPVLLGLAAALSSHVGPNDPAFFDRVHDNGLYLVLSAYAVCVNSLIPLVVGVVAGESVSGEAARGTLRYLLVAPVSRTRLLLAKFTAILSFCAAASLAVLLSSLVTAGLFLPIHRVVLLSGVQLSHPQALVRAVALAAFIMLSMLGMAAVGLFFSTLMDNPIAAVAAALGVTVVMRVVTGIPAFAPLHPYLYTHHAMAFVDLMRSPVPPDRLTESAWIQTTYAVLFTTAAWLRLRTRDVTC